MTPHHPLPPEAACPRSRVPVPSRLDKPARVWLALPAPALAALCLALGTGPAQAQRASLAVAPAHSDTPQAPMVATGIGDGGHLVGDLFFDGWTQAFRWGADGLHLLTPDGVSGSAASAVNRHGAVAGQLIDFATQAVVWDAERHPMPLPGLLASAINEGGSVAGTANAHTAFRFSLDGGFELLPGLDGGASQAWGIASDGRVVGVSQGHAGERATLWGSGGAPQDIGIGSFSRAVAVSPGGLVVASSNEGAYLWDSVRGAGSPVSDLSPLGVNDAGQVVGWGAGLLPVLWNAGTGAVTGLAGLLPPGMALDSVAGINRHAQLAVTLQGEGDVLQAGVLTLHPDWRNGSGRWHDGQHWDWAGTGVAAAEPGAMHDAHIEQAESDAGEPWLVTLDALATVRTLVMAGAAGPGSLVLQLDSGQLQVLQGLQAWAGASIQGHGTIEALSFELLAGAQLGVAAGEWLTLRGTFSGTQTQLLLELGGQIRFDGGVQLDQPTVVIGLPAGFAPAAGQRFELLGWTGELVLQGGSYTVQTPRLPEGLRWDIDRLFVDGSATIAVVPEPATVLLMALGVAVLLRRRLRQA